MSKHFSEVTVKITNKDAIYVDDRRITLRGTKWGRHRVVDEFTCSPEAVYSECLKRGYTIPASYIEGK